MVSNYVYDEANILPFKFAKCSICLEIIDNNKLVATPCNHYFCQGCIQEHLKNVNNNCPNCRQEINNTLYKDSPV